MLMIRRIIAQLLVWEIAEPFPQAHTKEYVFHIVLFIRLLMALNSLFKNIFPSNNVANITQKAF